MPLTESCLPYLFRTIVTNVFCLVCAGDNFYFTGVENEDSIRFTKTFVDVYTSKSLQIPWYVIAGNHDHYGNVTGQIDYTRHSKIWKFPYFYHSHVFQIPGTQKTLQIILIDTILLCGHSGHDHNPKPLTGMYFLHTWHTFANIYIYIPKPPSCALSSSSSARLSSYYPWYFIQASVEPARAPGLETKWALVVSNKCLQMLKLCSVA